MFRPGVGLKQWRASLFLASLAAMSWLVYSQAPAALKREDFSIDPGWTSFNSRQPRSTWPVTKQNFGWQAGPFPGASSPGQVGGLVSRSITPARYSLVLPTKTLRDRLVASGKFRVPKNHGNSGALFGWFHENSRGWRTPNSLVFRIDGNGPGYWMFFEYGTQNGLTAGKGLFEGDRYQTTPTRPFAADGTAHDWKLEYDPNGAGGRGLITFTLDGQPWELPLEPGHKEDGAEFNRFGIFNQQLSGDSIEVRFADLEIDGEPVNLARDPNWESTGAKIEFEDKILRPINNAGWRDTARAGGSPGEMGGLLWRDDPPAFLATPISKLTFEDELIVTGRIVMTAGAADSGVCLGWFQAETKTNRTPSEYRLPPRNALAVLIEGPSRVGHYFRASCWDQTGQGFFQDSGPIMRPDAKSRRWSLRYNPKAADGRGEIKVTLDGEEAAIALPDGMRQRGAIFDHFGFFNFQPDGHFVEIYVDDLEFTSQSSITNPPPSLPAPTLEETARQFFGSERARKTLAAFPSRGERTDPAIAPKTPAQTIASFELMEGLVAEVVLHEPIVRQPLFLNFDERGRMWVVQFIQYPYPAGLKVIDFDDQFHAVYDKVPPPPPRHDRGADKISIHEDKDGDGNYETHKIFLEGLNMVTAVERGRGGVWVLNPPYLVFWPDRNADDTPDGPPIVHLAGFGLEDTHSAANSLRWGPDGWLYGGQGSGVSSTIKRPGLDTAGLYFKGQVIWRYRPESRAFELFAEGGGNTFSLEFDSAGRAWSGINGNNHRGFHFVQGGYYSKGFGEHGYFTNPNTFGYFSAMPHDREAPRFSHTFIVYEGGSLGSRFTGKIIAPVPLHHHVMLSELVPLGSTYSTRDQGKFLESTDRWFRPVDIKTGPDGAVYLADWYDTRLTHMDPRDTWDRAHGRIYRIRPQDRSNKINAFNLAKLPSAELIGFLSHTNKWFRQSALRAIADRRDRQLASALLDLTFDARNVYPLDTLWALYASGGFDARSAMRLLQHPAALARFWAVRLIGEEWGSAPSASSLKPVERKKALPVELRSILLPLAKNEPDQQVRSQLASTARRLPADVGIALALALATRPEDLSDPHIPLLLWWAIEAHASAARSQLLAALLDSPGTNPLWTTPIVQRELLPRLARLYATVPTFENQQALANLLRAAPTPDARKALLNGVNEAFRGRAAEQLIASLEEALNDSGPSNRLDSAQLALLVRRGDPRGLREALAFITRPQTAASDAISVINALGESRHETALPALLDLLARSEQAALRQAALAALGNFESGDVADDILARWSHFDATLKRHALAILSSRKNWALRFLRAAGGSGTISKADVPDDIALRLRLFNDPELNEMCDRYFGKINAASTAEKQQRIERITQILQKAQPGELAAGKQIFAARCGICHTLFGEGAAIGPDLTGAERANLENMLLSIIDPGVAIREGFTLFQIQTKDGRDLVGFITERGGGQLTLRDPAGQLTTLALEQISKEQALSSSIMPEGLLDDLEEKALADFFAYFRSQDGKSARP